MSNVPDLQLMKYVDFVYTLDVQVNIFFDKVENGVVFLIPWEMFFFLCLIAVKILVYSYLLAAKIILYKTILL